MPLVGKLITTTDFQAIEIINNDKSDLQLHICNSSGYDAYVSIRYVDFDGRSITLYPEFYPIRQHDAFSVPYKLTLKNKDQIFAKSSVEGVEISLLK